MLRSKDWLLWVSAGDAPGHLLSLVPDAEMEQVAQGAEADALAARHSEWGEPLLAVLSESLPNTMQVARRIHRLAPTAHILMLSEDPEAFRQKLSPVPMLGTNWSIVPPAALAEAVTSAVESARSRRRIRGTLDRINLRLSTAPPSKGRRLSVTDKFLASVLSNAHDAIMVVDPEGRVVSWNLAAETVLGIPEADAIGEMLSDLVAADQNRHEIEDAISRGGRGEAGVRVAMKWKRQDGGSVWVDATFAAVSDEGGRQVATSVLARDITSERAARERDHFLLTMHDRMRLAYDSKSVLQEVVRSLAEHLDVAKCVYSEIRWDEGRLIMRAQHGRGMSATPEEYPLAALAPDLLSTLQSGLVHVVHDAKHDVRVLERYERLYEPAGVRAYMAVPVLKGSELQGILGLQHDTVRHWKDSEVKLAQEVAVRAWTVMNTVLAHEEIRSLNSDLEERVRQRTAELEEANREMEGFTYTVSHDLRAPLRAIVSTSMILQEDYGHALDDEMRRLLSRQALAARRLATLVDDLLRLSRISRAEMERSDIDLTDMAEELAHEVTAASPSPKPRIKIEEGLTASGDERLLRLAMQNLFENAAKFTKPGEPARIQFGCKDGVFFVKDQGIGFDPQYAERIFRPFERLHRDEEYPGTGVGLANVKRVVERHGGEIWAEGRPDEGATFYFTLGR
jgi:PAS domain S-box-containing protein